MVSEIRTRMVASAAELLARQGVQATSFGEVIKATGASRGSIYHHFPDGKNQLIAEAVDLLGAQAMAPMEQWAGQPADTVVREFLGLWRSFIQGFELQRACAILTVTVTADSDELMEHAATVFVQWRETLAGMLVEGGLSPERAPGLAVTVISAAQGALVLCRAERSMAPFDVMVDEVLRHVTGALAP